MTNIPSTSTSQQLNITASTTSLMSTAIEQAGAGKPDETMETAQIEDGELPEDGEIMEDEEEVPAPVPVAPKSSSRSKESSSKSSKKHFLLVSAPSMGSSSSQGGRSANKSSSSKYKDYDSVKTTKKLANQDAILLNSWVSGVQKKSGKAINEAADSVDPNEEYYGVANTSGMGDEKGPISVQPGNENDPSSVSSTTPMGLDDKDYRMTEEGALLDQDVSGGFGEDSDYRRMQHSPTRQDRRRRRSNSPDDYQNQRFIKRQRGGESPTPPLSGRFRRNPIRPRWAEHTICKFFREGFCRDGDDCAYSHLASDSHRRTDLCKYYQHGYCKKGLACLHLHGEYPCKAFHKGECSKEQCQYSHQVLDEFTQPIFDQMMRDEELASRISLPSHPLRRKVLLPLGPETSVNDSQPSNDQSFIPPPSVIVPVLSTMPPTIKTVEDKVMAQTGTYGFFNPITPVNTSANTSAAIHQTASNPFNSPPNNNNNNSFVLPVPNTPVNVSALSPMVTFAPSTAATQSSQNIQSSPIMNMMSNAKIEVKSELEQSMEQQDILSGGFNINQMLEKITQQVNASSSTVEVDDSPASPPSFFNDTSLFQDTKMIPVIRSWKLHMVDVQPTSPINIDFKQIQSSPSLKNDPRVKKQVESQFDQGTENLKLATSLLPPLPCVGTSAPKLAKPIDPRTKDPRKKAATATPPPWPHSCPPSCPESRNPGCTTPASIPPSNADSSAQQSTPFEEFNLEKLVQKQIQMANQLAQDSQPQTADDVDVDHRPAYGGGGAANQAPHQTTPTNGVNAFAQPSLTTTGFGNTSKFPIPDPGSFANLAAFEPPPFTNPGFPPVAGASPNYGHTSYYSEPTDFSRGGGHRVYRGSHRGASGYDRRQSRDHQHNDQQQHNSRWEHPATSPSAFGNNRKHQNGTGNTSPGANISLAQEFTSNVTAGGSISGTAEAPLTLREKRKNNEYESPLARVTSRY